MRDIAVSLPFQMTARPQRTRGPHDATAPLAVAAVHRRRRHATASRYHCERIQAAALKPADFFGNDDVLYLMEDMATGEIRVSILWEWLHKQAPFTEDDAATGVTAGDTLTEALFERLLP